MFTELLDISKLTGIVICYTKREEMDKVHARLKELKLKEPHLKEVGIGRAFNHNDGVSYPWTIALIVSDAEKLKQLDDYLTDSRIDLGEEKELYSGEPRIQDFFSMLPLDGKFIPGLVLMKIGKCPRGATSPLSCSLCPTGHLLECHYPYTCEKSQCQHLSKYDEF